MLVKIIGKTKKSFWYNVDDVHNVLPHPIAIKTFDGVEMRYIVKQPVFSKTKGYRTITVSDCEVKY